MHFSKGFNCKAVSVLIVGCGIYAMPALADPSASNTFQGFDLGVGAAIQHVNYGGGSQTNGSGRFKVFNAAGKTKTNAFLEFGYNVALPVNGWLLGIQAAFQPIHAATTTRKYPPGSVTQESVNHRYDFSVLPGYLVTADTLIYGKIGYSLANEYINNENGAWNATLHYKGCTAGLGVKSFMLGNIIGIKNFYTFAEYNYVGYGSQNYSAITRGGRTVVSSKLSLHANTGLLGVGYTF